MVRQSAVGGQRTYPNLTIGYNKYLKVGAKDIIAIHSSVCLVTNEAPFYDVCELGNSQDLRGYQVGQFRDNRMLVGQLEYRRELFWKLVARTVSVESGFRGDAVPENRRPVSDTHLRAARGIERRKPAFYNCDWKSKSYRSSGACRSQKT